MKTITCPIQLLVFFCFFPLFVLCQEEKRPITIADLLRLKSVQDPQMSPDGLWVAFTVSEMDLKKDRSEKRIWMAPTMGGDAIPMTGKGYSAAQPRWSPDNKFISFLAAKDKEDKKQVWTLDRRGGEAQQLTKIPQGVSAHEWSPKGDQLLLSIKDPKPEDLTEDKEDDKKVKPYVVDRLQFKQDYEGYLDRYRTHLYLLKPSDSVAVQITFGDYEDESPIWSPDGSAIAFVSNRSEDPDANSNTDIWIVGSDPSQKGKDLRKLTTNTNSDTAPTWSPDGKHIAYITVTDKEAIWYATKKLAVIPSKGGQHSLLATQLDRNISAPKFSANGKHIYFILEESGTSIIGSISPLGKDFTRVLPGNHSVARFDLHGETIVPLLGKAGQPYELFSFVNGSLKQLTSMNNDLLSKMKLAPMEKINFHSMDGTAVEGFVVKPVDFDPSKKYPTILWLHGGPVSQYQYEFDGEPQLFAANGYLTLLINPRGSSGYGQEFSQALFADWGNKDYQDVMGAVDHVIELGMADPDQLGVGGWSYGGILTNYVITKSQRFKGAVSGASEALYRANYGHDHYQLTWEMELGLPWENAEAWEKISPFNNVANITTPTLWMGGEEDWNVPILNSEQMYQAMKRLGKDTQLVVYPGEHHGIARPSFVKDRLERYLGWFQKHVKKGDGK